MTMSLEHIYWSDKHVRLPDFIVLLMHFCSSTVSQSSAVQTESAGAQCI